MNCAKAAPVLGLLTFLTCTPGISFADGILTGGKLDRLETKSGRIYEDVTVREVTREGVKIMHSSGATTIPASELPQFADAFAKASPAKTTEPAAEPAKAPLETPKPAAETANPAAEPEAAQPAWLPASAKDVADCSLFVNVSQGLTTSGALATWNGTAFLCNHGGVTYIYSNAHNFNGCNKFEIKDSAGTIYNDFAAVEIAADGNAFWKAQGFGGDVVRIRLANFREKALTLDPAPLTANEAKGRKILVTGNTGGAGKITQLTGAMTELADSQIIIHNAATRPGNSGSPIVDPATYRVIGILTWGLQLTDPLQEVWMKKPEATREGINVGAGLANVRFEPTSFDKLKNQQVVLVNLLKNVRLFGLLDTLIPTSRGLFVDPSQVVMGDYTVADLLAESSSHPVVADLITLDKFLRSKSGGNIGISNQDMLKKYIDTYSRCLSHIVSQRKSLENTQAATFFMKCHLRKTRAIEICKAYEALSNRNLAWYRQQRGTGGQALPLEQRIRLPAMRSGLNGLGLKTE